MSVLGKFKTALLGNPVTREYEIGRHVASGGPSCLWKIYDGVKKNSRQPVSIFVYDKKAAEAAKVSKKEREQTVAMLKKGPTQLIKLRHPKLLTVEHGVEESRDCVAFASEPVSCSLANVLGNYENLPSPLPLAIKEYDLHPVELKYGLLQIAEGLAFLHNEVKMLHGNLTPENIFVTKQGLWKIAGFHFCSFVHYQSDAQTKFEYHEWNSRDPFRTQPSLDYLAPEYILSKSCEPASDMFSFGVLVHAGFNRGQTVFESGSNVLTYKQHVENMSRYMPSTFSAIPPEGQELVRLLLNVAIPVRPDALQVAKAPFFDDAAVVTLQYLDTLVQKDEMQKSQFFKSLHKILPKMPKRVVHQHVLTALAVELRNYPMIPFILPNVLLIAEDCTMDEYARLVLPVLIPVFRVQEPIQVLLIFLQKMDLLLTRTPPDAVKTEVLPMIFRALDSNVPQIQELCVSILPSFANMIDYTSMKHSIVPKLRNLCLVTTSLKVRINVLVCIGKMLDVLDKWLLQDHVLPLLEGMPSREPGVLMSTLGVLKEAMNNKKLGFDKEILARRIVPFLMHLAIEPGLNETQFKTFMNVIKDMIQKVESDHSAYLNQLGQMQEQTRSTVKFAQEVSEAKAMDDMLDKMEKLMGKEENSAGQSSPFILRPSPTVPGTSASGQGLGPTDITKMKEMDKLFAGLDSFGSGTSSVGSSQQDIFPTISQPPDVLSPKTTGQQSMLSGWSMQGITGTGTTPTSSPQAHSGPVGGGSVFDSQVGSKSQSLGAAPLQSTSVFAAPTASATSSSAIGLLQPQVENSSHQSPPTSAGATPLQPLQPLQPFGPTATLGSATGMGGLHTGLEPTKPQSSLPTSTPASTASFSQMSGVGLLQPTPPASNTFNQFQESRQGLSSGLGGFEQTSTSSRPLEPLKAQPSMSSPITTSLSQPMGAFPPLKPTLKTDGFAEFQESKQQPASTTAFGQVALSSKPLEPMKPQAPMPSSTFPMTSSLNQPMAGFPPQQQTSKTGSFGEFQENKPQGAAMTAFGQVQLSSKPPELMKPQAAVPSSTFPTTYQPMGGAVTLQPMSVESSKSGHVQDKQPYSFAMPGHTTQYTAHSTLLEPHPSRPSPLVSPTGPSSTTFSTHPISTAVLGQASMQINQNAHTSWSQHQNPVPLTQTSTQHYSGSSSGMLMATSDASPFGQQPLAASGFQSQSLQPSTKSQNVSGFGGLQPQRMAAVQGSQFGQSQPPSSGFGQSMSGIGLLQSTPQQQPSSQSSSFNLPSSASQNTFTPQTQWSLGGSRSTEMSQGMSSINWNQPQAAQSLGPLSAGSGLPQQPSQPFGLQSQGILQPTPVLNPSTHQPRMPMPLQPSPGDNPFG